MDRHGFTLIELTIALAIGAMITAVAVTSMSAATDADLRSAAITLTGAIKMNYDRSIMLKRTQRIGIDIDQGTWWVDYTEDRFALSADRDEGRSGADVEKKKSEDEDDRRDSIFSDESDSEVMAAMEGGAAIRFGRDDELGGGKPVTLPSGVCFSRVWTGHQEEAFTSGTAYLHFFPGGWTEPALIELADVECEGKKERLDEGTSYSTLKVMPLTGRVRTYHERVEVPRPEEHDGTKEGDL